MYLLLVPRIEHEITGDVLLELDLNLLKEIDILAFGKRMKLAAAIAELRPVSTPQSYSAQSSQYIQQQQSSVYNSHQRGSSVRSGSAASYNGGGPQSPTFGSSPGGGPNPVFTFGAGASNQARQMSVMTTDSYYAPQSGPNGVVSPEVEMRGGSPVVAGERSTEFGDMPLGSNVGNGSTGTRVVGLGLNGEDDVVCFSFTHTQSTPSPQQDHRLELN